MGVELNIVEPIGGVSDSMDGGVRVGDMCGVFVEMHLESVVTK